MRTGCGTGWSVAMVVCILLPLGCSDAADANDDPSGVSDGGAAGGPSVVFELRLRAEAGEDVTKPLADALGYDSVEARRLAVLALRGMGERASGAIDAVLHTATSDPERSIRYQAILCLPDIGADSRKLAGAMSAITEEGDDLLALAAHAAMAQVSASPGPHIAHLVDVLREQPEPGLAAYAAEDLGHLGNRAAGAVPALVASLNTPDPWLEYQVIAALGRIRAQPEVAIPALARVARADERARGPYLPRLRAVLALGEYLPADESARAILLELAEGADLTVRAEATSVLSAHGEQSERFTRAVCDSIAGYALLGKAAKAAAAMDSPPETLVSPLASAVQNPVPRVAAVTALGRYARASEGAREAVLAALQDSDWRVASAAIGVVADWGVEHERTVSALAALAESASPEAAETAIRALADMGAPARSAVPALRQVAEVPVRPVPLSVRMAARRAVDRISRGTQE